MCEEVGGFWRAGHALLAFRDGRKDVFGRDRLVFLVWVKGLVFILITPISVVLVVIVIFFPQALFLRRGAHDALVDLLYSLLHLVLHHGIKRRLQLCLQRFGSSEQLTAYCDSNDDNHEYSGAIGQKLGRLEGCRKNEPSHEVADVREEESEVRQQHSHV